MKLKWEVAPTPVGRYRSFAYRGWPTACFENGWDAAKIWCPDSYVPSRAKVGDHPELKVWVMVYNVPNPVWRLMKKRAKTVVEAKQQVKAFFDAYPEAAKVFGDEVGSDVSGVQSPKAGAGTA